MTPTPLRRYAVKKDQPCRDREKGQPAFISPLGKMSDRKVGSSKGCIARLEKVVKSLCYAMQSKLEIIFCIGRIIAPIEERFCATRLQ